MKRAEHARFNENVCGRSGGSAHSLPLTLAVSLSETGCRGTRKRPWVGEYPLRYVFSLCIRHPRFSPLSRTRGCTRILNCQNRPPGHHLSMVVSKLEIYNQEFYEKIFILKKMCRNIGFFRLHCINIFFTYL